MYDVIVVGAGPAGSATAKKCIELGLKTLILEKKTLPREKVCSGMVMGKMANDLIQKEFGIIPENVLTNPGYLKGIMIYAPGIEPVIVEQRMPFAWRRDLDFWMTQKAKQAGAELKDNAKVTSVEQKGEHCLVRLEEEVIEARFVVGADGTQSTIRRQIYPKVPLLLRSAHQECYLGKLPVDREYFHWMFPLASSRPRLSLNHKGEFFIIGGGLRELKGEIPRLLQPFGFSTELKPEWKDSCISGSRLAEGYLLAPLPVARGNILMVGDAAMLQYPVSGEGICTALKSGLIAARSITEAIGSKGNVAEIYSRNIEPVLNALRGLLSYEKILGEANKQGAAAVAQAFADGLRATFALT
jgi:flavin-dependent dehydrogenase